MNENEKNVTKPEDDLLKESLSGNEGEQNMNGVKPAEEGQKPTVPTVTPSVTAETQKRPVVTEQATSMSGKPVVQSEPKNDKEVNNVKPKHEAVEVRAVHDRAGAHMSIAIVLAVLVALVLIGLGYAAYVSMNEDDDSNLENTEEIQQADTEEDTTGPIESNELESEIDEIEDEINSLDDSEYDSSQLSDESLGL